MTCQAVPVKRKRYFYLQDKVTMNYRTRHVVTGLVFGLIVCVVLLLNMSGTTSFDKQGTATFIVFLCV